MSLKNNPTPIDMIRAIKELEEATASGGTAVSIAGTPVATLGFTSDPQTQLDNKANADAIPTDYIKYDEDTAVDSGVLDTNYVNRAELLNLMYPVGSIYMSVENVSPASFIGGYWERIAEGRTLIGQGTSDKTFTAGEQDGASTHTLTTAQIPSHNHGLNNHTHSVPDHFHDFDQSTANQYSANVISGYKSQARYQGWVEQNGGSSSRTKTSGYGTAWAASGACTTGGNSGNTTSTGSGSAHNNLPPYLVVYMWKRIPSPVTNIT